MQLSLQPFTSMVQNAAAAAQAAALTALDFTVGSVMRALMEANVGVAMWLQWLIVLVLGATRLATSFGIDVDSFVGDYGLVRLAATPSSTPLLFARYSSSQAAQIPVGSPVKTNDATQTFTVNLDTTNAAYQADPSGLTQGWYNLPGGTASITLNGTAAVAGTVGNVLAGTIGLIAASIPYIDTVTNPASAVNGANAESDVALKLRFVNYINTRASATLAAILYAVTSIAQNITASVAEFVNTASVYTPGAFVAYVDDGTGSPSTNTLTLASAAINAVRACGIQYAVQPPTVIVANISYAMTLAAGVSRTVVEAQTAAAVTAYVNGLAMGVPLAYSRLGSIIYGTNSGITNVTGLLLNGAAADLGGVANQAVRIGVVTPS